MRIDIDLSEFTVDEEAVTSLVNRIVMEEIAKIVRKQARAIISTKEAQVRINLTEKLRRFMGEVDNDR